MPASDWMTFQCDKPDFVVRSIPDDISFKVNRALMSSNSDVFRDMFSFGDNATASNQQQEESVDILETSTTLIALLRLVHSPPAPPVLLRDKDSTEHKLLNHKLPNKFYEPSTVIPLPLLTSLLYPLVDKYAISDSVSATLDEHLRANAPAFPLPVYGFATAIRLDSVASEASQYLMPLASYTEDEVAVIPTVLAYHKLVRLQDLRIKALRELLIKEDIFPHGYGACPTHQLETTTLWNTRRIAVAAVVETATDISGEMEVVMESLPRDCKMCQKACNAAVQMLAYKGHRIIKKVEQLPVL